MWGDRSGLGLEEAVWSGLERATRGGWAVVGTGTGPGPGLGRDEGGMGAEAGIARYLYRKRNPFQ